MISYHLLIITDIVLSYQLDASLLQQRCNYLVDQELILIEIT